MVSGIITGILGVLNVGLSRANAGNPANSLQENSGQVQRDNTGVYVTLFAVLLILIAVIYYIRKKKK